MVRSSWSSTRWASRNLVSLAYTPTVGRFGGTGAAFLVTLAGAGGALVAAGAFLAGAFGAALVAATTFLAGAFGPGAVFFVGAALVAGAADFFAGVDLVTVAFLVGALAVLALGGAAFLAGVPLPDTAAFLAGVAFLVGGVAFLAGAAFFAPAGDFFTAVNSTSFGDEPGTPRLAHCGTETAPPPTSASG